MKEKNEFVKEEYLEMLDLPVFEEYTFWEHLKERKIILNDEINNNLIERVIMQILKFNQEDINLPMELRKPIRLYIHSNGGDVITGLALCSIIENSITPVYTYVFGLAASMSGLILMSGHKRFAYSLYSTVLVHDGFCQVASSGKKAKQTMKFYNQLEKKIKQFILGHTKITEKVYEDKASDEWYFMAEEALELGVIDEIIK